MRTLFLFFLGLILIAASGQSKQRKLGNTLNSPSNNYWAPFISLDGNSLLLQYDYTDDRSPALFISLRQGVDWKEPILIPRKLTANALVKGHTLSPDGKTIFITTTYQATSGGFDIMTSQFNGSVFTDPVSIGAPINSPSNDGCPTLSPDGNIIYFMRCTKMSQYGAEGCKILMAKKRSGQWEAPTELPASVNAGNSQMPRMLGDGQTLVFSSDRHTPNKGGMDWYISKFIDNQWSAPVNLDFVNTKADDLYASASYLGVSLLKDVPGERKSELVEFSFPPEIKPKAALRVVGVIDGVADLTKTFVNLVNLNSKQIQFSLQPDAKGNFVCYIPEGNLFGLTIDAPSDNFKYFIKRYDLTNGTKGQNLDRVNASLKPLASGDAIEMGVSFNPFTSEINQTSIIELQKASKMMRGNPSLNFTVDVTMYGYQIDSIQAQDLTETLTDTVVYQMEVAIDSVTTETRDSIAIEYKYHNDRTAKQAQAVMDYLVKLGVKSERLSIAHQALPEPVAEKKRTVVYLKTR